MLLPQYWLRQKRLQRALRDYPIYDPPHKSEERVLPRGQALENFQYFLDVRLERVKVFNSWLTTHFGIKASLDQKGVENTLDWAEKFVGILLPLDIRKSAEVFFGYALPWTGDYAGANPLFDLAATLGESVIRLRPQLRWQMEWSLLDYPTTDRMLSREKMTMLRYREHDIREQKRDKYAGYRRPLLASLEDPIEYEPIFSHVDTYQGLMRQSVTIEFALQHLDTPKGQFSGNREYLRDWFRGCTGSPPQNFILSETGKN